MKFHLVIAAGVVAVLAMPLSAQAQGIIRGGEEGAAAGNRAAGPVGGAVGGVVGGVEGGIVGGVKEYSEFRSALVRPAAAIAGTELSFPQIKRSIRGARCPYQS